MLSGKIANIGKFYECAASLIRVEILSDSRGKN